jgi:hypothetical protein
MEEEIVQLIEEKGPLTGSEIWDATKANELMLWRTCNLSEKLRIRKVGYRYLRLDQSIEGFARLSPSIRREFLTYSVVGLAKNLSSLNQRAKQISAHIEKVSKEKSELAYSTLSTLMEWCVDDLRMNDQVCCILAGDIVYNMAHDVPREERSTGKLVKGSDMDLVVIVDDLFPERLVERLDEAIYQVKYRLLTTPHLREEIDYIIKRFGRVRGQMKFDTFKDMVACKILHEGTLLYGSERVFHTVKALLKEHGVIQKLNGLERKAEVLRHEAEEYLLKEAPDLMKKECLSLFYPTKETDEFE